ncbi:TusE/DsrC/DsvC family sulfur relay protein [Intrasporangium calvum]|uniref:TusE/DsrC/DsvC family sulfur relay protein n=1 Tax=Intrasporangium calvum TaxID=53358 RepID=A0ABT5GJ87_9MICO|nr:TusE/DsrC/DsvC family sulfur relay protein [Intrasporangium calvum]MDC5697930.1 TusE/DsrC/DsvC family sulfur relay protein [Intrasporangium calvum]
MPTTTIAGTQVEVNEEGFLSNPDDWNETLGTEFARLIGVEMSEEHWRLVKFLREDYKSQGETPTLRRVSTQLGLPVKQLFTMFPGKPAKKMSYVAGVPKPKGCV